MTSDLNREVSAWTGARQTMSAWAKVLESPEEVPEVYRSSYDSVVGNAPDMPYTVLAPAIAGMRRRTTEKLLCVANGTIYVWERLDRGAPGGVRPTQAALAAYPLQTISDLEMGGILLFSWITIGGVTQAGAVASTTVEFNTATSRHFAPFVEEIRPAPDLLAGRGRDVEQAKFDHLEAESFKFMSFGRDSLVPGEEVHQIVWQPKISKPLTRLWRFPFQKTLSLAHLVILTDKELILVQDDERSRENRGVRYGGKWRYIALPHIGAVALPAQGADGLTLSLTLVPGGRRLDIPFAAARGEEIARLAGSIEDCRLKIED